MESKFEQSIKFIKNNNDLICPFCKKILTYSEHILKCDNNHTFDISKKGTICLISNKHFKASAIYNKELFINRRKFIINDFYREIYKEIIHNIPEINKIKILDLGCGEGSHLNMLLNSISNDFTYYGLDYSKEAVFLASDYCSKKNLYFIGDINNIPLKDESIDVIIDFLSPYNEKEIKRVLKKKGKFIKICPGEKYLIELRNTLNMDEYKNMKIIEKNLKIQFPLIAKKEIYNKYAVTKEQFANLIKMTPMKNKKSVTINNFITINMVVYTYQKE